MRATKRDAIAQGEVTLLEIGEIETSSLCSKQHRECGVLCILDGVDGIHHHAETKVFAHPENSWGRSLIMLVMARICPPARSGRRRRPVIFEKRDAHCIAGGVPIC